MRFTWRHALLIFLCLVPFLYAMQFAFPAGDDFDRAVKARYLFDLYEGLHEMLRAWWRWSGRYTHHFLVVFLGDLTMSQVGYTAAALGLALVYGIGFMGLFASLSRPDAPVASWFVPGLLALFTVYGGLQTLDAVAYLLTDILGIGIGSALVIWFIWGLCRLWHAPSLTAGHLWFPAVCGVLGIGCYEHAGLAIVILMGAAWVLAWACRHPYQAIFSKLGLIICIAFALSFFTRGNFRRQTKRGMTIDAILPQMLRFGGDWLEAVGWYMRSVFPWAGLGIALAISPRQRAGLRPVAGGWLLLGGLAMGLALSVGITLVHAVSDVPINEAGKLPANMAVLLGIFTGCVLMPLCAPLRAMFMRRVPGGIFVVLALAGVILYVPNTLNTVAGLTSGQVASVYKEYQQRMAVIGQAAERQARAGQPAAAQEVLDLAPLSSLPYPVRTGEPLGAESSTWPNPHAARLYNVPGLRVTQATASATILNAALSPEGTAGVRVAGLGLVRLVRGAGANASYDATWLQIEPEPGLSMPTQISLLLVPAPGPDRLVPIWLQRILLGEPGSLGDLLPRDMRPSDFAAEPVVHAGVKTRFFAFSRTLAVQSDGALWLASAHPLTAGAATLFVSTDGGASYTRIGSQAE